MKTVWVAFDVDGTLISHLEKYRDGDPSYVVNERIRTLLITFASFKNVKIIVWSGSGEWWARQVAYSIGIPKYVDKYMAKNIIGRDANGHPMITADVTPDIAFDDIQDCILGVYNLIVKEK